MSSVVVAAPILVRQAIREHRSGRLDSAADLYARALAIDPADPDALHLLGALHLQRGEPIAAVPFAAKAVLVEPATTHAYNNLGLIMKGAGEFAGAARCYMQATLISPRFAEGHSNLGVVLKAEGQTALAIEHYRLALDLDPSLGEAWNNLGNALQELGELEDAVDAYLTAADRMPDSDTVHYNVGLLLEKLGRREDAMVHLKRALELAPGRDGARHLVSAMEGETTPTAPRSYVRELFDAYAVRFEAHLVGDLGYCAHRELVALLDEVPGADRRYSLGWDLGCGTGLAGAMVRGRTDRLVGVDLSAKMLQHAGRKGLYDQLVCADIDVALDEEGEAPDLVTATDVFIYIGQIEGTFARIARRMVPGGIFAFSVETASDSLSWFLRPTGRYAHSNAYVTGVLTDSGLRLLARRTIVLRRERGEPIEGAVYVAAKPSDGSAP